MSRIADIGGAFCLVLLLEGTLLSQAESENVQVQFGSGWKIEHYTQSSKPFQIAQSPAQEWVNKAGDRKNYQAAMERLQQALKRLQPSVQNSIPEPSSWLFPDVIESARTISPRNVEGRIFNQFGLAYSLEELEALPVATMTPQELQKYADIVTHAYPDAVFRQRLFAIPISTQKIVC